MKLKNRKQYYVLPLYQTKLFFFTAFVVFLALLIHGLLFYHIVSKNISSSSFFSISQIHEILKLLRAVILVTNSLSFFIITSFYLLITLLLTHRIAGPLLKVAGHIRRLTEGKIYQSKLKFRKGDEGLVLCDSVNHLQDKLQKNHFLISQLKSDLAEKKLTNEELINALENIESEAEPTSESS